MWVFPKTRGIMENPIRMDDLGVPIFLETPMLGMVKFSEAFALSFREGIFHKHSKHVIDMLSHFETIQHLRAEYLWCLPICMVKMGRKELNKKPNHGRFFNDVSFFISVYFL